MINKDLARCSHNTLKTFEIYQTDRELLIRTWELSMKILSEANYKAINYIPQMQSIWSNSLSISLNQNKTLSLTWSQKLIKSNKTVKLQMMLNS